MPGLVALLDALPDPAVTIAAQAWTRDLLPVPENAALPLAMTGTHPRAVGSYGPDAGEWAREELGITLRWGQRLVVCRLLEHDADRRLVWERIVESAPRRAGKSVELRVIALWRLEHAELFHEPQTVLLTSKDLGIGREIMSGSWRWVREERADDGWTVRQANGQEHVATATDDRWLLRAGDATTGYSINYAQADESWGIKPSVIADNLEPATMERESPQLHLTSTAHPRATSLMKRRLLDALRASDPDTLLLWWGAHPNADPSDPKTWRAASPYWSEHRAKMMAAKYKAALAGEQDPEFDDLSPMESFESQYLNRWGLLNVKSAPGDALVTDTDWQALIAAEPDERPTAVAVESWPGDGVSVAAAWRLTDGRTFVSVTNHPDVAEAAAIAASFGCRTPLRVGASLADDPAWRGVRTKAQTGAVVGAVADLARWLHEAAIVHDGGEHLAEQITAVRTLPAANGLRLKSDSRADAVKAAAWAIAAARATPSNGANRMVLPTGIGSARR